MSDDRWRQVNEVLKEAMQREPDARASFIAQSCGGDESLQAEVKSLLAHDAQVPADFLQPAISSEQPDSILIDPLIGQRVGHYEVKRMIGRGGMGSVYLAIQDNPQREVALKILKPGIASRYALRHFAHESRLLARLTHANIAQIYEAGTHHLGDDHTLAIPFFAMEYVPDAKPITDYAKQQNLSRRKRLEMFSQVCDAVHHGHQKGVIHRDLKPANILADSTGTVKVIDFGIARCTDADIAMTTMKTDLQEIVGTVQYMSPEQCGTDPLQIDSRSDVYSLGVVLYELLCGCLPYETDGTTIAQLARAICEQPPQRPSHVQRALRGDLELILMKALEKKPEDRYASADALGQDIRRFLAKEPIEARPPTAWTSLLRWVARHPLAATTTACTLVLLAMMAAASGSNWFLRQRPHEILLAENGREAQLVAVSGNILRKWNGPRDGGIRFAKLLDIPDHPQRVIIGFGDTRPASSSGALCAFSIDHSVREPIWKRRIESKDLPSGLREKGYSGDQYEVKFCRVEDFFPDRPGMEILAVFHNIYSAAAIRIYDWQGTLLYEVWHNGTVHDAYWLRRPGYLVFSGIDADLFMKGLAHANLKSAYPEVVFAIRPVIEDPGHEFLNPVSGQATSAAVWYKYLHPRNARALIHIAHLNYPVHEFDPDQTVQYTIVVDEHTEASVYLTLDENGDEIPGSRVTNDPYRLTNDLPDPDQFYLGVPFWLAPTEEEKARSHDDSNGRNPL